MSVKIHITNFQSIKKATIEVDRLTVVTGTNNSGKTAVIRGVRGVFQNTGGTAFIRHGEKMCSVEVDFGVDGKVVWSKGTSKRDRPTYVINDGEPIYPGSGVPDEVAAFGVIPIQAGGQEVWPTIAPQVTGQVFLLDRPGSALAEAVADVERVGQLNRALRSSEGDRRQASAALKVRKLDLSLHEAAALIFEGLDDVIEDIARLESKRVQIVTVARAILSLVGLRDRLDVAQADADKLAPVSDITVPRCVETLKMGSKLQDLHEVQGRLGAAQAEERKLAPVANITVPEDTEALELRAALDELHGIQGRLNAARTDEEKYQGINDVLVEVDDGPTKRVLSALEVLFNLQKGLKKARESVVGRQLELEQASTDLIEASDAADAALAELGQCPTCGIDVRLHAAEGSSP